MADQSAVPPIERLEIISACQRLTADYAWSNDKDRERVGMQFAEDAEMRVFSDVLKGRAAIRAYLASRDPTLQTMHVATNFRIDVESAERARGTVYVMAVVGTRKGENLPKVGRVIRGVYHDRYRKVDGAWFIAERSFEEIFQSEIAS